MSEVDRAVKAQAILESPVFAEAFTLVRQSLLDGIERCSIEDTATAEDFRKCLKLLRSVRANLEHAVRNGQVVEFRRTEEEARKKNPLRNLFR